MKTVCTLFLVVFYSILHGQESSFTFSPQGLTRYIVTEADGNTKEELFKKINEWILKNYQNPTEVIKAKLDNEYIRIQGVKSDLLCTNVLGKESCQAIRYTIEFAFKNDRYKLELKNIEQNMPEIGWTHFPGMENGAWYFDKSGNLKPKVKMVERIPQHLNSINDSILDYIKGKGNNQDNW